MLRSRLNIMTKPWRHPPFGEEKVYLWKFSLLRRVRLLEKENLTSLNNNGTNDGNCIHCVRSFECNVSLVNYVIPNYCNKTFSNCNGTNVENSFLREINEFYTHKKHHFHQCTKSCKNLVIEKGAHEFWTFCDIRTII